MYHDVSPIKNGDVSVLCMFSGKNFHHKMVKIPAIQAMFGHDDSSSLQPGRLKENPRVSANSWMKRSLGKLQMTDTFAESSSDGNDFNDIFF